jgi:hypothetical protein
MGFGRTPDDSPPASNGPVPFTFVNPPNPIE